MSRTVDDLVDEYVRLAHDGRALPWHRTAERGERVEFCGDEEQATLTFVREEKITLLGVGSREETVERYEALQAEGVHYAELPAASVVWGGQVRGFRPLGGGAVLGVAEHGQAALVLGLVRRTCVAVLVDGRRRVVCATPWSSLTIIDLDAFLQLDPPPRRAASEVCAQDVSDRICGGLRNLVARATAPISGDARHRGKMDVQLFVDVLIVLSQAGCGDLCGRASEIVTQIQRVLPRVDFGAKRLGVVLGLIERTGTVLVERPTPRTWLVRLAALRDVSSAVHKAVCAEVPRRRLAPTRGVVTAGRMLRDLGLAAGGAPELGAPELGAPERAPLDPCGAPEAGAPEAGGTPQLGTPAPEVAPERGAPEVAPARAAAPKNWTTDLKTLVAKVLPAGHSNV